jgi:hypothetical protein
MGGGVAVSDPGDRFEREATRIAGLALRYSLPVPATVSDSADRFKADNPGPIATIPGGIIQRDVLPVARFSPEPGILVDRAEKSVTITGVMELYGDEANAVRAASIQNSINSSWTQTFPDGYTITCHISVTYRGKGSKPGSVAQVKAEKMSEASYADGDTIYLNANEPDAFTWTPAHEFGHIMGLKDRYSESIMSKIKDRLGMKRDPTPADPGYEANIMGVSGGVVESENVKDIAVETGPSPYWINDDDEVRDWVNGHSLTDIGKLSTGTKLKAIDTLMGGWISDDDVAAISRICEGVQTKTEAETIRTKVDLLQMSSIGQRTRVRVAFANMPK